MESIYVSTGIEVKSIVNVNLFHLNGSIIFEFYNEFNLDSNIYYYKKIGCLSKETGSDKGCHRQAGWLMKIIFDL